MKKFKNKARLISIALLASGVATVAPAVVPQSVIAAEQSASDKQMYEVFRYITFYYKYPDGSTKLCSKGAHQSAKLPSKTYVHTFGASKASNFLTNVPSGWRIENENIPSVKGSYNNPPAEFKVYLVQTNSGSTGSENATKPVTETKTVKRTIQFVKKYKDGRTERYGSKTQSATFSRTGYTDANGKKQMPSWSPQTWDAVTVPTVAGFRSDISVIPAVTFTPDNAPKDRTVYLYESSTKTESKTVKRTIRFVGRNANGKEVSLGSASQSATINRVIATDANGKVTVLSGWSKGTIPEYTVPDRDGYTKTLSKLPAIAVYADSKDTSVTVYYNANNSNNKPTSLRGWKNENGKFRYYGTDGKYYTGWHYMSSKEGQSAPHWSYFGSDGYIYTGWKKMGKKEGEKVEHWSYFGANGWLRTGWQNMGTKTNPDGSNKSHWSYFGANGWLRTGWQHMGTNANPDGKNKQHWSYFGPNGWLRTGLQRMGTKENPDGGSREHYSYFGSDGWLVTNRAFSVAGVRYIADGRGWLSLN